MRLVAGLAALMCGWHGTVARAHDPPRGRALAFAPAGGGSFVVSTNRGLIFGTGAGGGRLLCHAGLGAHQPARLPLLAGPDGRLWVAAGSALWGAGWDGCGLSPVPSPATAPLVAQDLARDDRGRLWLLTAGQRGHGVHVSADGGASWQPRAALDERTFFSHLGLSAGRVYATGSRLSQESSIEHVFARSDDDARSFTLAPLPLLPGEERAELLAVVPGPQGDRVFVRAVADSATRDPDRLLVSEDGGAAFLEWLQAPEIAALAVGPLGEPWLASAAGLGVVRAPGAVEQVAAERPAHCVAWHAGALWVCDGLGVVRSRDRGRSFERVLTFAAVDEPVTCDDQAARACAADWLDWDAERAELVDAPTASGASGCGVASTGASWWVLCPLVWRGRRRPGGRQRRP